MSEIYEVYDTHRNKFIKLNEAMKSPHLCRSQWLKCPSCGDEIEFVYGIERQYFRHKSSGIAHSRCPLYSGYQSNSIENIFYNKFKNIVDNKISYVCTVSNNKFKYYLHIPSFSNEEISTLTSSEACISIVADNYKKDIKLAKDIFTKNNSVLIELKDKFKIAHLQLYVKGKFIGVYKILGLDFSSILNCYLNDKLYVYDNPRYVYLNKKYVIVDKPNSTITTIDGIKIENTIKLQNDVLYVFKIIKNNNQIKKYISEKGSLLYTYGFANEDYAKTLSEDMSEKFPTKTMTEQAKKTVDVDLNKLLTYVKVGGYLYHNDSNIAGSKITKIDNETIFYLSLDGKECSLKFDVYYNVLLKLIKFEEQYKIKLGELYTSQRLRLHEVLVCGLTGNKILYLKDNKIIPYIVNGAYLTKEAANKPNFIKPSNVIVDDGNSLIPGKYAKYIKVGGYFYHTNEQFAGSRIKSIKEQKIFITLLNGKTEYFPLDIYFHTLEKLIKLEGKYSIKLGLVYSSKKRKIEDSLVCGLNEMNIILLKNNKVFTSEIKHKVKMTKQNLTPSSVNKTILKIITPETGTVFYTQSGKKCIIDKVANGIAYYRQIGGELKGQIPVKGNRIVHDYKRNINILNK